jgi:hypothetical protein
MRVITFAASLSAVQEDTGGIATKGFPMTSCYVDNFPAQITIPMVVAFCAAGGGDYDPVKYITATSPDGERVGTLEFRWHWHDNPPSPIKFRVFAQHLPIKVTTTGVYTIGLYDSPHSTETDHIYPLPILRTNPLVQNPTGA